ncbi:MAG: trypsin-like peptidase domain-containing protein [Planctomycetota bacterium]
MRRFITAGPALIVLCAALLTTLLAPFAVRRLELTEVHARVVLARQTLDQPESILEQIDAAVRSVAEAVEPSVVHIDVDTPGFGPVGSTGSGWVWDSRGHLITNAHVVTDASKIRVEFADGYVSDAELLAADAFTDIAVLKIRPQPGLIPANRASGGQVRKGERIFSFGSPFGFKFSMTEGIVSGLGRSPRTGGPRVLNRNFTNFIQTDAAVNPGNSGGPVVDVRGRVVGMNVAIATGQREERSLDNPASQSAGISFAIPLSVIESVVEQLIDEGAVRRGFLGVGRLRSAAVEHRGEFLGRGVYVGLVVDGNAADRAGIRSNDVVTGINGNPVRNDEQFRSEIATANPGEDVLLTVFRDGRFIDLPVRLDEWPEGEFEGVSIQQSLFALGVDFEESRGMVIVKNLVMNSTAVSLGLEIGQAVVAVEGVPVATESEFHAALGRNSFLVGQPVEITLRGRGGRLLTVDIRARR